MKKIYVIFAYLVFIMFLFSCVRSDNVLRLHSYDNQKMLPSTIFSVEINKEYSLNEDYEIIVEYGHIQHVPSSDGNLSDTIALLKIHNVDETTSMNFEELMLGETLLEIDNFLIEENVVLFDVIEGEFKNFKYNKEVAVIISKDKIIDSSGILMLSFTCFSKNEDGSISSINYDGSIIYVKYEIKNDKVYFEKK